ncbi:hypothetical protein [Duganella aceris]|uniref:Uncharacterized protein n=1 Tax=Duganella aceris TaxID=2703883 RepID=A0ABX0FPA5_9BURK|nr:hypothetical protein [Duganella aceris]NGZ86454.1 hypothetical protein [Duganella aceris]
MELTQDFEVGINERIQRDRALSEALLGEIDETLAEGEDSVAQELLRMLVVNTVGFAALSPSLSMTGDELKTALAHDAQTNPASLSDIASALKLALGVSAS